MLAIINLGLTIGWLFRNSFWTSKRFIKDDVVFSCFFCFYWFLGVFFFALIGRLFVSLSISLYVSPSNLFGTVCDVGSTFKLDRILLDCLRFLTISSKVWSIFRLNRFLVIFFLALKNIQRNKTGPTVMRFFKLVEETLLGMLAVCHESHTISGNMPFRRFFFCVLLLL